MCEVQIYITTWVNLAKYSLKQRKLTQKNKVVPFY